MGLAHAMKRVPPRAVTQLVVVSVLGLTLLGCAQTTGPTPDTLQASRGFVPPAQPTPEFNPEPFAQTVHDSVGVGHLYRLLLALPKVPTGPMNCPVDRGLQYSLTFSLKDAVLRTAIARAGGCQVVILRGNDARTATAGFWSALAQVLNWPLSDILPTPTIPTPAPTSTAKSTP